MTGLVQADAVQLPVADDSVDLVITSPPYFALRSYQDDGEHYDGQIGSEATPAEFLDALWAVTAECVRVLKPSGSLWVNLGDKYARNGGGGGGSSDGLTGRGPRPASSSPGFRDKSLMGLPWRYAIGCIDDLGLILRAEVVWSKPNGLPESVTDRVRRSHEQWFHFTLEPRYFSAIDEIRDPHKTPGGMGWAADGKGKHYSEVDTRKGSNRGTNTISTQGGGMTTFGGHPLGKLPGSVWSIPTEPLQVPDDLGVDHFAAFPQEWPRRLILGWCPAEVCTACGQGRAPVTELDAEFANARKATGDWNKANHNGQSYDAEKGHQTTSGPAQVRRWRGSIVGYACACPDTTAPSTPGVVLDPFCGTGTVPMVARALRRIGIGVDLSSDYLRLAAWRVFESGHASKTVARTNGERQGLLL